jgi:hypothetical protein
VTVLTLAAAGVTRIGSFNGPALFAAARPNSRARGTGPGLVARLIPA